MALRRIIPFCGAAICGIATLSGCVVTNMPGKSGRVVTVNGATVTVNGVNVTGGIGANSAEDTVQKRFIAGSVSSLKADANTGSIEISSTEAGSDEIHVQATRTIHGSDSVETLKPLLADVSVQAELVNGALVLSSKHPADFDKRNISVSVDYVVTVPQRLALDLRTGSGAITVHGIKGDARLHTDYGGIELTDIGGSVDASTTSGAVSIHGAEGAKRIDAKTDYGDIDLTQVSGAIDANTSSGTITVQDARNAVNMKLHSDYGKVSISNAAGSIDASSSSGVVRISDSQLFNHLSMHSDYGSVEASNITSAGPELRVELTADSGTVTYEGQASDLTMQSDYGAVNGELGSALTLRSAALRSSSGAVTLALPASTSAKVDASTSSGNVDLPNGHSDSSGSVTLGQGAAHVKLESDYGNVALRTK
jgi:DUF4097 and DUF4098 domain-containing protein YvlB